MAQSFKTGITVDNAAAASSQAIATNVNADTHNRLTIDAGGKITWGSGSGTGDTVLYRSAANTLKTDDAFTAASLAVTGAFSLPTSDGSANQVLVTDGSGNVTWENNTASAAGAGSDGQFQYNNGGATAGANALYYDDTNVRVGVGTTSPDEILHVVGDSKFEVSDDGSAAQPEVTLHRESASPADGDYLGQLKFSGKNDAGQTVNYAKMTAKISDVTDTTEDGLFEFAFQKAGSLNIGGRFTSTDLKLINGTGLQVDGNVGIGNTSPSTELDVTGTVTATSLTVSGDATFDTSTLHVDATNNRVGIGNTTPAQALDVSGTVTANALAVNGAFTLPTSDGSADQILVTDGSGGVSWADNSATVSPAGSDGQIQYNNGGALGGASQLYFDDSTARLGVGTSSPGAEIEISNDSPTLRFTDTDTTLTDNELAAAIEFYGSDSDDTGLAAYIHADADGTAGAMQLRFGTGTAGVASDRMTIQADGSVGIGTTSPGKPLHIYHATMDSPMRVESGDSRGAIEFKDSTQTTTVAAGALGDDFTVYAGGADRLAVTSGGNVGIGTTSPAEILDIASASGSAYVKQGNGTATTYLGPDSSNTGLFGTSTSHDVRFITGNTERVRIDTSGNVGIGTTSPSEALAVDGNIDVVGTGRTIRFGQAASEGGPHGLEWRPAGTLESALYYRTSPNSWSFEDGSGGKIAEFVSGTLSTAFDTDTLYVDGANDRVGINTSSPPGPLQVSSQNRAVSVLDYGTNNYAELGFTSLGSDGPAFGILSGYHLYFRTGTTRGGLASNMILNSDGNLGVGTTSPSYKLDVNGNMRSQSHIDVTSGTNNQVRLTASTTSARPYLTINNWNGSSYVRRGYIGYPAAGSSTANINVVADNGDVNISPELTINGGPKLSDPSTANELRVTTAHGYIDIGPKNSTYCHIYTDRGKFYLNKGINSAPHLYWRDSSGIGGPLADTSSTSGYRYVLQNQTFGTFFDYTSVRDRKDQITNVTAEDSGRWIDALQPVTYIERWMGEGEEPEDAKQWREADMQVGFIADDILADSDTDHFSQVLDNGEGGLDPAGWKWECVIAATVAELKSLRARVAELEAAAT